MTDQRTTEILATLSELARANQASIMALLANQTTMLKSIEEQGTQQAELLRRVNIVSKSITLDGGKFQKEFTDEIQEILDRRLSDTNSNARIAQKQLIEVAASMKEIASRLQALENLLK